jgi:AcrR family transcriptional regulator
MATVNNFKNMKPEARKEQILEAAVRRAEIVGIAQTRRDDVALEAGVGAGLVSRYFGTMNQLKRAIIRHAVHHEILPLVAQALVANEPEAMKASKDLKERALASLVNP